MNRKTVSLILLTSFMLTSLYACGETDIPEDSTESSIDETTAAEETTQFVADDLPDDLDFGGKDVNIFIGDYSGAFLNELYSEEATGNRLNDAVYHTIQRVQERLNVNLVYDYETYYAADEPTFGAKIAAGILAGDSSFDLLFDVQNYVAQMLEGDYFINLAQTKYISPEKPWYNQSILENMADGYLHFLVGQFSMTNVKSAFAMYYNDELYRSLGHTEELYSLVDEGKWTMDKLEELLRDSYADLNGNTLPDASDRYGLTFGDENKYMGFLKSLDISIFEKTDDSFVFTYDNERAVSAIERLCRLINENEAVLIARNNSGQTPDEQISSGGGNYVNKLFVEGRALFTCSLVGDAAAIVPEINFDYGLLPYPKWDEAQEDYYNILQRYCFAMIPVTVSDEDAASAVLEALSSESYRTIIPEYFEVTLKTRYSHDDNVSRMFDLISQSVRYDPGEIYGSALGYPSSLIKAAIRNNNSAWSSTIASRKNTYVSNMEKIVNRK